MRLIRTLCLCGTMLSMAGCATSGYWADRRADLTDFAHVDTHAYSFGVAANAGPAIVGRHAIFGDPSSGSRTKLGLGGFQETRPKGEAIGVVVPLEWREEGARGRSSYSKRSPAWGSFGFDLGFFMGFGFHADIVELADFILAWTTIDILDDDTKKENRTRKSTVPSEGAPSDVQ